MSKEENVKKIKEEIGKRMEDLQRRKLRPSEARDPHLVSRDDTLGYLIEKVAGLEDRVEEMERWIGESNA